MKINKSATIWLSILCLYGLTFGMQTTFAEITDSNTKVYEPVQMNEPATATQQSVKKPSKTTTQERGTQTITAGTEETKPLNLPSPVLPIIDIGTPSQFSTQSTRPLMPSTSVANLVTSSDAAKEKFLPQVLDNQYKISSIAILGVFAGFLLAILLAYLISLFTRKR